MSEGFVEFCLVSVTFRVNCNELFSSSLNMQHIFQSLPFKLKFSLGIIHMIIWCERKRNWLTLVPIGFFQECRLAKYVELMSNVDINYL